MEPKPIMMAAAMNFRLSATSIAFSRLEMD
jgi:hypothetical protein